MARARYRGEHPVDLPTLGLRAEPGQVVDVPEGFSSPVFEPVPADPPAPAPDPAPHKDGEA